MNSDTKIDKQLTDWMAYSGIWGSVVPEAERTRNKESRMLSRVVCHPRNFLGWRHQSLERKISLSLCLHLRYRTVKTNSICMLRYPEGSSWRREQTQPPHSPYPFPTVSSEGCPLETWFKISGSSRYKNRFLCCWVRFPTSTQSTKSIYVYRVPPVNRLTSLTPIVQSVSL